MSRTARYKLQYVIVLGVLLAVAGVAIWSLRANPLALLGVGVLFLIPGRLSGFIWRDLYRGRRLFEAGQFEASLPCSQRFVESISDTTVSPLDSTRSIRSALMPNWVPFSRVRRITTRLRASSSPGGLMPPGGQSVRAPLR